MTSVAKILRMRNAKIRYDVILRLEKYLPLLLYFGGIMSSLKVGLPIAAVYNHVPENGGTTMSGSTILESILSETDMWTTKQSDPWDEFVLALSSAST